MNAAVRARLLSGLLILTSAAATHAQNALPKPITRDSAGIRIIEYPTLGAMPHPVFASSYPNHQQLAKLPAAFRVDAHPYLDLGGLNDDPKQEFDTRGSVSVVELSDGSIAASSSTRILMYTKDGRFLRTVGRQGEGPGEFPGDRQAVSTGQPLANVPVRFRNAPSFDATANTGSDGTAFVRWKLGSNPGQQSLAVQGPSISAIE